MAFALFWTSSTTLRRASIEAMRSSVWPMSDSSSSTRVLSAATSAAVLGDVRQVRLAAGADLVHGLDFGLHGVDELLAARDGLDALVQLVGDLLDVGEARLDGGQLLLAEGDLRPPLLELLEHLLGARELIFRRLNLADRVALPAVHAVELGQHLVLEAGRPRQLFGQRLHLPRPLGDVGRHGLAGDDELGEALLLLGDGRLVELHAVDPLVRARSRSAARSARRRAARAAAAADGPTRACAARRPSARRGRRTPS